MFENEFKGKVVLVTGGSRGIGFAAVKGFLAGGAKVYFLSHYEETGAKALAALKEINPDYEVMTKAIDLYIHKLDSGEEVPPVTLEEQSPDLAFIQSQALKGRKTKPVAAKAPAPKAVVTTKKSVSAARKSVTAGAAAKK